MKHQGQSSSVTSNRQATNSPSRSTLNKSRSSAPSIKKVFALILLITMLALTGCTSGNQGSSAYSNSSDDTGKQPKKDPETLTIGLDDSPPQLDPHKSTAAVDRQVFQSVFNTLVDLNKELGFVPELAKEWEIKNGGKTYIFHLQEDVVFHDGTPFNAKAVKFNFERMLDPKTASPRKSEINLVKSVKVLDEYTVEINLEKPYAPFLSVLTDRAGMMVSPTAVKKLGKDFANNPVGTGPYKFVERVKQGHIKVTKFDKYWGTKPKIKNVVYKPFTDGNIRVTNLVSGQLDIINQIPYKNIESLKNKSNIKVSKKSGLGFQGLMLNLKKPPFNNLKVRKAVNIALDRHAIAKVVYHNGVTPAVSPFPPSSWAFPELGVPKANVDKAKQLIEASGLSKGDLSFSLKITPAPEEKQVGQMIQAMLSQIGMKVKLEMVEFGTLLQQMRKHNYQAMRIGWSGRVDPDGNAYTWFTSEGSLNEMGYSNPKVDELLSKARTTSDKAERKVLYKKVAKILWEDVPYVFLFHPNDFKGMKKHVSGYKHIADGMIRTEFMSIEK